MTQELYGEQVETLTLLQRCMQNIATFEMRMEAVGRRNSGMALGRHLLDHLRKQDKLESFSAWATHPTSGIMSREFAMHPMDKELQKVLLQAFRAYRPRTDDQPSWKEAFFSRRQMAWAASGAILGFGFYPALRTGMRLVTGEKLSTDEIAADSIMGVILGAGAAYLVSSTAIAIEDARRPRLVRRELTDEECTQFAANTAALALQDLLHPPRSATRARLELAGAMPGIAASR